MALVVLPEGTQISGSAGGTTWSHNRYGAYKRNRSIPVNTNTDRQVAIRNFIKSLTIAWQTILTQDQRDAWEVYAANVAWVNHLGQSVYLTGLNHYCRSNVPRLLCELARIDAAPTTFTLAPAELALACAASEATQQLAISFDDTQPWVTTTGAFQIFYMGIPKNAGTKFFNGPWRHCCCALGETEVKAPPSSPMACAATWPFAEGQRIWLQSRIGLEDGRLSELARCNFLAAA